MRNYLRHVLSCGQGQTTRTIQLDSTVRRIDGVFLVADKAVLENSLMVGLKYDEQPVLHNDFDGALMAHTGQLSIQDSMLPTPYERKGSEPIRVEVTVVRPTATHADPVIVYFVTEV